MSTKALAPLSNTLVDNGASALVERGVEELTTAEIQESNRSS